jgi:hypothetical protein
MRCVEVAHAKFADLYRMVSLQIDLIWVRIVPQKLVVGIRLTTFQVEAMVNDEVLILCGSELTPSCNCASMNLL